jgi:serine/threonine protein kinase
MIGQNTYGKPVDIWAVGFIMFELISGYHPFYIKGEDRATYQVKIKNFKQLPCTSKFSSLAVNLLEKLCNIKPSARYKVE